MNGIDDDGCKHIMSIDSKVLKSKIKSNFQRDYCTIAKNVRMDRYVLRVLMLDVAEVANTIILSKIKIILSPWKSSLLLYMLCDYVNELTVLLSKLFIFKKIVGPVNEGN